MEAKEANPTMDIQTELKAMIYGIRSTLQYFRRKTRQIHRITVNNSDIITESGASFSPSKEKAIKH